MAVGVYRVTAGPTHERHPGPGWLQGHYRIELVDESGARVVRYLTDKQRAEFLRRIDAGRRELSIDEVGEVSEPDLASLAARIDAEGGEGG